MNDKLVRCRALTERYGVVDRTIDRWVATGVLPPPMWINKIRYWNLGELEKRERERMAQAQHRETRLASA
jgi:hypothetical protein